MRIFYLNFSHYPLHNVEKWKEIIDEYHFTNKLNCSMFMIGNRSMYGENKE